MSHYSCLKGNPSPRVTWRTDDEQLNAYITESELRISSHLKIRSITWNYNMKILYCRVNVTGISEVLDKAVRLNIHGRPCRILKLNHYTYVLSTCLHSHTYKCRSCLIIISYSYMCTRVWCVIGTYKDAILEFISGCEYNAQAKIIHTIFTL